MRSLNVIVSYPHSWSWLKFSVLMSALIPCVWCFFDLDWHVLVILVTLLLRGDFVSFFAFSVAAVFSADVKASQKSWNRVIYRGARTERLSPAQDHSFFPAAEEKSSVEISYPVFSFAECERCSENDNSQIPRACADDWQQVCRLPLMFLHGQIFSQQFLHAWS